MAQNQAKSQLFEDDEKLRQLNPKSATSSVENVKINADDLDQINNNPPVTAGVTNLKEHKTENSPKKVILNTSQTEGIILREE